MTMQYAAPLKMGTFYSGISFGRYYARTVQGETSNLEQRIRDIQATLPVMSAPGSDEIHLSMSPILTRPVSLVLTLTGWRLKKFI